MRLGKLRILGLLMLYLVSTSASAVEVQLRRLYTEGTRLMSSEMGASITIPEGWHGMWPAGSSLFMLEASGLDANIFIYAEMLTREELRELMTNPIPLDEGIELTPTSALRQDQEWFVSDYEIQARQDLSARVMARTGSNGLGIAFIAVATTGALTQAWGSASDVAASLTFFTPRLGMPAFGIDQTWQEYMKGRYITRFHRPTGHTPKEALWLCS
ncbi:MAG: hypothetical protein WD601_03610, partial [Pseudohongiellaceae bacterium]